MLATFFLSERMDFFQLFTEHKKHLQDLYLYISLKNPSRFLSVTLENVMTELFRLCV